MTEGRSQTAAFWRSHPGILRLIADEALPRLRRGGRYGYRKQQSRVPDGLPHRRSGLIENTGLREGLMAAIRGTSNQ